MRNRYQPTVRTLKQRLLTRSIYSAFEWDHDLSKLPNRFCLEPRHQWWNLRKGA